MECFNKQVDDIENDFNASGDAADMNARFGQIDLSLINPFELISNAQELFYAKQSIRCLIVASSAALAFLSSRRHTETIYYQVERCMKIIRDLLDEFQDNDISKEFAIPVMELITSKIHKSHGGALESRDEYFVWCMLHLGSAFLLLKKFYNAKAKIEKAKRASRPFQDKPRMQAAIYHNLASAEYYSKNWENAISAFEKAREYYAVTDDIPNRHEMLVDVNSRIKECQQIMSNLEKQ